MYVTSGSGSILVSNDEGETFQTVATSIPMGSNDDGRSVGERLAIDPNDGQVLYFGSRTTGLWKSTDGAMTWNQVVGLPGLAASDGGAAVGPATTPNGVGIPFVQFDPTSCGPGGQTVAYAAVATIGPSLYRSDDGGATWTAVAGQPVGLLPNRAALSSTGALYITYGGGTGTNGDGPNNVTAGAVYRLDTPSGTWTNVTPVPATDFGFAGISVDAEQPQTVVVSTIDRWSTGDDIYRTTDSGQHWTAVGVPTAAHDVSAAPWVTFHQATPDYTGWLGDVENRSLSLESPAAHHRTGDLGERRHHRGRLQSADALGLPFPGHRANGRQRPGQPDLRAAAAQRRWRYRGIPSRRPHGVARRWDVR